MLTDTHCHLDDAAFDPDREAVIAPDMLLINPGCDVPSSVKACAIARAHKNVYAAVGIHPCDLGDYDPAVLTKLEALARDPENKVVAVGEIGLDYHYPDNPPREIQQQAFADQIALAGRLGLPFIVHDREAHADSLEIVRSCALTPGVFHAYSGSAEMAQTLVGLGMFLGIGGALTFKNAKKLPGVVEKIPLECLLLETDAPYMAPVPVRGTRNIPSNTRYVAEKIAEIKGLPVDTVVETCCENAARLFGVRLS